MPCLSEYCAHACAVQGRGECETGFVLFTTERWRCSAVRCDGPACGCSLKPDEKSCETRSVFARRGPGGKSQRLNGWERAPSSGSLRAPAPGPVRGREHGDAWMSWVIFPMVVSVLWAGVGRGRGLDPARACGEGELEDWADRPQQFPICLFQSLEGPGRLLGGAGRGKEEQKRQRRLRTV